MTTNTTLNPSTRNLNSQPRARARQVSKRHHNWRNLCVLLLVFLLSWVTPGRAQGEDACECLVEIGYQGTMCAFSSFTITLNDATAVGPGNSCQNFDTNPSITNKVTTKLKLDEKYTMTAGPQICSTNINFDVPEGYTLYIDGEESNTIRKGSLSGIGSGDGSWEIVVRRKCPCGDEENQLGSVNWAISMGKLSDGRFAEHLSIREQMLNTTIYTPAALVYTPPAKSNEVDVILAPDGSVRQIYAPANLADIVVINSSEYEIRLYRPADVGVKTGGLYPVTGQPLIVWKIKNPNPPATTRLQIIRTQNSQSVTSEYIWDPFNHAWTLSTGNGARIETRTISYPTPTSRSETTIVKDAAGNIASKVTKIYQTFPFGEKLVQTVNDPDAAALTTSHTYYENQTEIWRYGKLKSVSYADGSWVKYDYDTEWNVSQELRSWKDVTLETATPTNCRVINYQYLNDNGYANTFFSHTLFRVEERIEDKIVRLRYLTRGSTDTGGQPILINGQPAYYELQTVYTSPASSAAQEKTTTYTYQPTAAAFVANRMALVIQPNGTRDSYLYTKGNWVPNADPSLSQFVPDVNGKAEREEVIHGTETLPNGIAFKTTMETVVRDQYGREVLTESHVYNGTTYERIGWAAHSYDDRGNLMQTVRHNGALTSATWGGDLKNSEIDETGIETAYTYDALNRIQTRTKKGAPASGSFPVQADIVTTFAYDAEGRTLSESVSASGLTLTTTQAYDRTGRVIRATDQAGLTTLTSYTNSGRTQTVTLPGGATQITDKHLDGQVKSVTGAAVVAQYYEYGVDGNPGATGNQWMKNYTGSGGLTSPRWVKTYFDLVSRPIKIEKPSYTGSILTLTYNYNDKGQLISENTLSGSTKLLADKLYEYDTLGKQIRSGLDLNADSLLSLASTDRITESDVSYEKTGSDWFKVMLSKSYLTNNSATSTTLQTQKERLTNFIINGSESTLVETITIDPNGNQVIQRTKVDRAAKKVTEQTDLPDSNLDAVSISYNGLQQSSTPSTPRSATTYSYDALGRQTGATDPASGTNTQNYSAITGQLLSVNDGIQTTNYEYYPTTHNNAGRLKAQTNGAGKKVYFEYNSRGDVLRNWGDTSYPLEYVYNSYGEKTELRTFRAGGGWAAGSWPGAATGTADVTTWIYHAATGLLATKRDAASKDTNYTYDILGRLKTRVWARGITTTYNYDTNTGELGSRTYSDNTPAVNFTYDRGGRQSNVTDGAGTRALTFNSVHTLESEQFTAGMLNGVQVLTGHDIFFRRSSLSAMINATPLVSQTYGYDTTARLQTITSGSQTVTYGYYPATGLLNTTSYTGGTNLARVYDSFGRLQTITTTPAAGGAISYAYHYDSLGRRDKVTREDGSYWSYGYNDRGELVFGKKYWADNTPVAGMQFEYGYDNIGNRQTTKTGGNDLGANLRNAAYTANSLNQYTQRTVPSGFDVMGLAATGATVTVNNQSTYRRSDYFHKEVLVNNASGPVYQQVDVVGAKNNAGGAGEDAVTTQAGKVYVPQATETYTYDFDGNVTQDGRWTYTWDGENRLTSMTAIATVPVNAKRKLEFTYDYMARRIEKRVYDWSTGTNSYILASTARYIYNGWNLMAEIDGVGLLKKGFIWGKDISGTIHGAEGVGGLISVSEAGNNYQLGYDGNGNVIIQCKSSTGTVAAIYEYDPFGGALRVTGEYAWQNAFQFSTKYVDSETGLAYFGYRYYNPQSGRWLGRDPIEEAGGENLFSFVENNPMDAVDPIGLYSAGRWINNTIEEALNRVKAGGYFRAEDKKVWKAFGIIELGHKYGVNAARSEGKGRCCSTVAIYGAGYIQGKSKPVPWLLFGRVIGEFSGGGAGKIECCTSPAGGRWEYKIGSLYCRGDVAINGGFKLGVRWELVDWPDIKTQIYAEGGGYVGTRYSFRRKKWQLEGYFYATAVVEWQITAKHKVSRRIEYRNGTNVDDF